MSLIVFFFYFATLCSADPRYTFDPRCPPAVSFDNPKTTTRVCRHCTYKRFVMNTSSVVADCAVACCGDWSCLSFAFTAPVAPPTFAALTGAYVNHDSLRGDSGVIVFQDGVALKAVSLDPAKAFWTTAIGVRVNDSSLYFVFDENARNNRTGVVSVSADGQVLIVLERLPFDPANFTQVFASNGSDPATCAFMDDVPPPVAAPQGNFITTGVRAFLSPSAPPFENSTAIESASVNPTVFMGVDGDEFPTTWGADGILYTGAGDNAQPSPGCNESYASPASFFRVTRRPDDPRYPRDAFTQLGDPFSIADTAFAKSVCPPWFKRGLQNIKSSGVLDINGTMYWAVSCFNYGDDPTFNRQRYGPAWIVKSTDKGLTWSDGTLSPLFAGRLAAPRFVQSGGPGYTQAKDEYVYVHFPGTEANSSFFECNDAVWLGRVLPGDIMDRARYTFFIGVSADGLPLWDSDDTLAQPVFSWGLHTSVQQTNYHPSLDRYIFANWVWVSADGNPRPDHSRDELNERTARQRTMLTLFEADMPWGPWRLFHRDDNWSYADGSTGAYTPIFPAAWINATDDSFWMVSTQCCGVPEYPPTNNYYFNAQRVALKRPSRRGSATSTGR